MAGQHYERIWAVVRRIPKGRVATYGQVAAIAGIPRHARQVGYALGAAPESKTLPWQRVINAKGEVSQRARPGSDDFQQVLLEAEGVEFDPHGRTDLKRFQWNPRSYTKATTRARR